MTKPRVSPALTEARTVRSRALAGIRRLDYLDQEGYPDIFDRERDPEHDAIRTALTIAAEALAPYRKDTP